jgi:hypothetical protein
MSEYAIDDYFQQWLYDQDLIDRANDELNLINETKETE